MRDREEQIKGVRGAIIEALTGGHIDGRNGAGYSKGVLLQIAALLDIELPEILAGPLNLSPERFRHDLDQQWDMLAVYGRQLVELKERVEALEKLLGSILV